MNIFHATILGVVEGITEFLPISSTFHLIFASRFLGVSQNDFSKLFEVFIQSGAILSVTLLYFTGVVKYKELTKKVIISFVPTAFVGFILYKFIKNVLFENQILMIGVFALVGIVFILVERLISKKSIRLERNTPTLSYKEALIVGLIQSLAVFPGVSRAGAVIISMVFLRFKRGEAAYYSFLLSIPTIFAASFFDLYKMRSIVLNYSNNWILLTAGFVSAFISSYFVVKWFISFLQKNSLTVFAYYRILVAIILAIMFIK
ncbi:undecaprenyl-diphosphate phosphatase [Candidatus Roizmanbacteria bacterium]|nr:undecaprenyl-diphosphate phosphatase [Candidatus Roizmanbacteria bacterium]